MHLNRAVPVLSVPDVPRAVSVFRDVLGLDVVMDLGWVATLGSVDGPQISVMHEDATAACNPDLSLDVEDVDVPVALDDLRLDEAEPAGAPEPADVVARTAQLWPHRHGTDAMFLALLRAPGA